MSDFYRLLRRTWPYLGPLLGVLALSRSLDVGYDALKQAAVTALPFVSRIHPLWLAIAILLLYFSWVSFRHRNIPLTVISNDIKLTLETASGDRATLSRTQILRANHHDVTGYHRTIEVDPPGEIPKGDIRCGISHAGPDQEDIHFEGTPKRWELTLIRK